MINKNYLSILLLALLTFFASPNIILADEAVISGNGENTENNITTNISRSTEIDQSNQAEVKNSANITQNSGGNNVEDNLGETQVDTGDNTSTVNFENSGINTSHVETGCCKTEPSNYKISGNGESSQNNVTTNTVQNNSVNVTNNANITNNVKINSNTGGNNVNNNLGNVRINTGNVNVNTTFSNKNINNSFVSVGTSSLSANALIASNLEDSINNINFNFENNVFINVLNDADINNHAKVDASTGDNNAEGNLGGVAINTGDINTGVKITNKNINTSVVEVDDCDDDKEKPEEEKPTVNPPGVGGNGGNNSGNGGGGNGNGGGNGIGGNAGQVLAATTSGVVLPATGGNWLLLFTMANIIMFLFGAYLRLLSGRSPAPRLAR